MIKGIDVIVDTIHYIRSNINIIPNNNNDQHISNHTLVLLIRAVIFINYIIRMHGNYNIAIGEKTCWLKKTLHEEKSSI